MTKHNDLYTRRWKSKPGRLKDVMPRFMPQKPFERFYRRSPLSSVRFPPRGCIETMRHAVPREDFALWVRLHDTNYPRSIRWPRSTNEELSPRFRGDE
jgi:hypothetical protein